MKDFDKPERLEFTMQGMEDYEFGSYVEWIDYKDLLEAYKELKFILEGLRNEHNPNRRNPILHNHW